MKRIGMFLAATALVTTLLTACGSSGTSQSTAASTAASSSEGSATAMSGPTITIADMAFGQPLTVAPGTQINIVNKDTVEHSVTSDTAGAFSQDADGGESATLTAPSQPGSYAYHCKYHPNMHGTLIVK
jgi:plastocyanin